MHILIIRLVTLAWGRDFSRVWVGENWSWGFNPTMESGTSVPNVNGGKAF